MKEYVTLYEESETTDHIKYTLPIEKGEEIVRCRDCMFFKEEPPDDAGFCMYWVDRVIYHDADGFCAWGERREP